MFPCEESLCIFYGDPSSKNTLASLEPLAVIKQGLASLHQRGYLIEAYHQGYHSFVTCACTGHALIGMPSSLSIVFA